VQESEVEEASQIDSNQQSSLVQEKLPEKEKVEDSQISKKSATVSQVS